MRGATSAPTGRVLDVVELLAQPGNEQLRFTDVARALDLTQATAHAILKTLCDRGWAVRDPVAKTFTLGPALALVGARVDAARPLAHAARAVAARIAQGSGYPASVVERVDDHLVITAFEGVDGRPGSPGDRIPFAPPFGVAFAAWDTPDGQKDWIRRAAKDGTELAGRLGRLLTRTRERGYEVDWTTPALTDAAKIVGALPDTGLPPQVRQIMDRLLTEFTSIGVLASEAEVQAPQPVATIAAPVFGRTGRTALIVAVHPLRALSLAEVADLGSQLTSAAASISP